MNGRDDYGSKRKPDEKLVKGYGGFTYSNVGGTHAQNKDGVSEGPLEFIEIAREAYLTYSKYFAPLLVGSIIVAVLLILAQIIPAILAVLVVGPVMTVGYNIMILRADRGETPDANDLFRPFRKWWEISLVNLYFIGIVALGTLLLIVPGIIWAMKYSQIYHIISENLLTELDGGVVDSRRYEAKFLLSRSAELTEGYKWQIFLYKYGFLAVACVGLIICFGVFLTLPLFFICEVYLYKKLVRLRESNSTAQSGYYNERR